MKHSMETKLPMDYKRFFLSAKRNAEANAASMDRKKADCAENSEQRPVQNMLRNPRIFRACCLVQLQSFRKKSSVRACTKSSCVMRKPL